MAKLEMKSDDMMMMMTLGGAVYPQALPKLIVLASKEVPAPERAEHQMNDFGTVAWISTYQRYFPDHFLCDVSVQELSTQRHLDLPSVEHGESSGLRRARLRSNLLMRARPSVAERGLGNSPAAQGESPDNA